MLTKSDVEPRGQADGFAAAYRRGVLRLGACDLERDSKEG